MFTACIFQATIVFKLWHDNKYLKESIYSMFCHLSSDPTMFRALAHHVQGVSPPCLGCQPTTLYPTSQGQTPDRSGRCTPKVDRHVIKRFTIKIITSKHVYYIISLFYDFKIKWFEMRAQPSISSVILLYKGKRTGFGSLCKIFSCFCF